MNEDPREKCVAWAYTHVWVSSVSSLAHFWAEERKGSRETKNISSVNFIYAGMVLKYILLEWIIMIKSHWENAHDFNQLLSFCVLICSLSVTF